MNFYLIKQFLCFGVVVIFSFKLAGQEIIDGYQNGRQIIGTKVERNLEGEAIWKDRDSSTYIYDIQQRLIKKEDLYFNDTTWVVHTRIVLEYDSDDKGYVQTFQQWFGDVFMEDKHKISKEFNEQNQLVDRIISEWINENWVNLSKTSYQYDERGNITSIGFSRFVNNEWKLSWEEVMTFDDLNSQTSRIYRQVNLAGIIIYESGRRIKKDTVNNQSVTDFWELNDGELLVNRREINFLSHANLLDSTVVLRILWDTLELNQKIIYEYNLAEQLIQSTIFDWKNSNWHPFYQIKSIYNNNGQVIFENNFLWSEEEKSWIDYREGRREWTYSEEGTLLKEVDYTIWAIEYEPWIAYDRNITYYANPLSVSINTLSEDYSFQLFPNPTLNFLQIKTQGIIEFPFLVSITNLQGQVLKQQKMSDNLITIQLDDLPNGIYFIRLQDKTGRIKVEKIIKQ